MGLDFSDAGGMIKVTPWSRSIEDFIEPFDPTINLK
jgi:hypothetical protein